MYKWILLLFMSLFMAGCIIEPYGPEPTYVWHEGHWYWTGAQYYWVPGGYVVVHPHCYHYYHNGYWHSGCWHHR